MGHNIRYLHGVDPQTVKPVLPASMPLAAKSETLTTPASSKTHSTFIPKLAESLFKHGIKIFRTLLEAFVLKSDDTLYQMSKNASVNQDQHTYFSALRCLRLNKTLLTQRFEQGYEQAFYEFFAPPVPVNAISSANLSIVEKEALEIDLAGELMAKRTKQRCDVELINLHARLESLCSHPCCGKKMPFEPLIITVIFKQLLQDFELDTKSTLVMLKEFEHTVLKYLPELIVSLNQQMIKMGVLPTLNLRSEQYGAHRSRVTPAMPEAMANKSVAPSSPTSAQSHQQVSQQQAYQQQVGFSGQNVGAQPGYASATMQYAEALHQNFEQWLSGQLHDKVLMPGGTGMIAGGSANSGQTSSHGLFSRLTVPNGGDAVRLDAMQLTPMLTHLQQQLLHNQAQLTSSFLEEAIHQRAGLMRYVHQHLQKNYQQGYQLDPREHNILGLLTQVFSQVLEQEALPKLVRYSLWRLQIPYLKVALQDTHFFIDANHPARQLLTLLADAGLRIDLTKTCNDPLLDQIDLITKRVLNEYDQDISLFVTLIAEFRGFLELQKRRTQLLHQRLLAVEEGKARREAAEQEINFCLQRLLTDEAPESVRTFAQQWWWKVLFYIYLKEGSASDDWRRAIQCMQNLMTTVLPKASAIDVEIAKQGLADLIQQLRAGLLWIGCEDAEIKQLIKPLRLVHSVGVIRKPNLATEALSAEAVTIKEAAELAESIPLASKNESTTEESTVAVSTSTVSTSAVSTATVSTSSDATPPSPAVDAVATPSNSPVIVGEWIEYVKKTNEIIRCQLVMHLPSCDKMIFINRIGMKVLECKGSEFKEKLLKGECRKLPQTALFDQALRQVIELMQVDQSKSWRFA
jgi:hypothetical protein